MENNPFFGNYLYEILKMKLQENSCIGELLKGLEEQREKSHYFINSPVTEYIKSLSDKMKASTEIGEKYYRSRIIKPDDVVAPKLKELKEYGDFLQEIADKVVAKYGNDLSLIDILNSVKDNDLSDLDGDDNEWDIYDKFSKYANLNHEKFSGFSGEEADAPPSGKASEGRINPEGISYLYLSKEEDTSVWEVKPHVGDLISVSTFEIKRKLTIFDVSYPIYMEQRQGMDSSTLLDKYILSQVFSRPANGSQGEYWVTQYISEFVETLGFDGIKFTSSLDEKENLVLFHPGEKSGNYTIEESRVFRVCAIGKYERILPMLIERT